MTTTTADYYALLGVDPGATPAQIKKAYRTLAKQYHPDMNNSPDAAERFREITEAYDTLTDPDRRRRYDRLHSTGRTSGADDEWSRSTRSGTGSANGNRNVSQAASPILKVLEETWLEIRRWHPDIPPAVIIIASGTDGKNPRWGHHAPGRWNVAGQQYAEVMISGEGLRRSPREVLATLLHEAAHALAAARGERDTSRQGRYHNKKYAALARELGLDVTETPGFGWTATTVPGTTADRYAAQLDALKDAMTIWRNAEHIPAAAKGRSTNLIPAECSCRRRIRVAASTLDEAPIICQACDGFFKPAN